MVSKLSPISLKNYKIKHAVKRLTEFHNNLIKYIKFLSFINKYGINSLKSMP